MGMYTEFFLSHACDTLREPLFYGYSYEEMLSKNQSEKLGMEEKHLKELYDIWKKSYNPDLSGFPSDVEANLRAMGKIVDKCIAMYRHDYDEAKTKIAQIDSILEERGHSKENELEAENDYIKEIWRLSWKEQTVASELDFYWESVVADKIINDYKNNIDELTPLAEENPKLKSTIERMKKEQERIKKGQERTKKELDRLEKDNEWLKENVDRKLNTVVKQTEGVPPMVEEARDEDIKAFNMSQKMIKQMGGLSDEERKVISGCRIHKTQSQLAVELKCSPHHIRYVVDNINSKFIGIGITRLQWNRTGKKKDYSKDGLKEPVKPRY